MTELPEYSTKATWILYHTQKYFDSNFDLTFGKSQWKGQQLYHNNMLDKNKNFEIILSLESPTKNVDCRAEIQYKVSLIIMCVMFKKSLRQYHKPYQSLLLNITFLNSREDEGWVTVG